MQAYEHFIQSKVNFEHSCGLPCEASEINPLLKPHQRDIVQWAIRGGRRAIFAAFGLGKTFMQLEIARLTREKLDDSFLIVAPLGVRQEFRRDAEKLGIDLRFGKSTRDFNDALNAGSVCLTNYESIREQKVDVRLFAGISLDEAGILRGFGGTKTFRELMGMFEGTGTYRFVATATPSPNEFIELLAYAAFLDVMDVGQAKTRFFKRDSTSADNLTLHPHKEREFWLWVSSWAIFLQKPSDLRYSDEGYDLPQLDIHWHELPSDHQNNGYEVGGQGKLLRNAAIGVSDAAKEKRESLSARVEKLLELRKLEPAAHRIIWHDLESEREAIEEAIPECQTVYGSQDLEVREMSIAQFSDGNLQELAAKPVMLASGCNFQYHCAWEIFLGIGFKFNDLIQAIHRVYRFLQTRPVRIDLIYTEAERGIRANLEEKWERHKELTAQMTAIIRQYGLASEALAHELRRSIGVERQEIAGENFRAINNDSVIELRDRERYPDDSVHLILTSIPFSTQFEYSPCYDEQTEVLTKRGWLSFGAITPDDQLATVTRKTLALEWQAPSAITWQPYSGDMVYFESRNSFNLLVTPDHRMLVDVRVGNRKTGRKRRDFEFVTARDLAKNFTHRKWILPAVPHVSSGIDLDTVLVPRARKRTQPRTQVITALKISDFLQLAGWYLSEGSCRIDPAHNGEICICQSPSVNAENRKEIVALLTRIGLRVNASHMQITSHNVDLANFLVQQFGTGAHSKRIPRWIKDLAPNLLRLLRDTMMKGDGNKTGYAYTSFSAALRDDFQEICLATGWRSNQRGNLVRIGQRNVFPEIRQRPSIISYSGMIGCATVPNGTLVVRRNGAICISGNSYNDFGHTDSNEHFFKQMDFLTPELFRVLAPGRIAAIHVKDRVVPSGLSKLGFQVVYPFHSDAIAHYTKHGFGFLGMKTIVTDVVRENGQTYRLGWTEQCKDGSKMGAGMPEYLLLFRKPPTDRANSYADLPVVKDKARYSRSRWQVDAHGFARSSGNRLLDRQELLQLQHAEIFKLYRQHSLTQVYNFEDHVKIGEMLEVCAHCGHIHLGIKSDDDEGKVCAQLVNGERCRCHKYESSLPKKFMLLQPQSWHPDVWTDITRMLSINSVQAAKGKQMHLCPLQFDIADRVISQFSMEGETVLDPFAGLMTVPFRAVRLKRKGIGIELATQYFLDGAVYCRAAENEIATPELFGAQFAPEEVTA